MGILDDAGVNANEVPKDPFGFGNDYWPVAIIACNSPKVEDNKYMQELREFINPNAGISSTGKQFGTSMVFRALDERFQHLGRNNPNQMPGQLGFGQWFQLPSPKWAQHIVPFDKESTEGKKLIFNWATLLKGVGIPADEMGKAEITDVIGQQCLARIKATENDNGFWEFRVLGMKPLPKEGSPQGIGEFTAEGTSNPAGMSAMERALAEENNGD